jgi:prevent-host-death family protein
MDNSMITNMISVTELQRNYTKHLAKANKTGEPLLIVKNNRPEAVLMSHDAYEIMAKKARLKDDQEVFKMIRAYEKAEKEGKLIKMKNISELFD